jgi:hypothetical protein
VARWKAHLTVRPGDRYRQGYSSANPHRPLRSRPHPRLPQASHPLSVPSQSPCYIDSARNLLLHSGDHRVSTRLLLSCVLHFARAFSLSYILGIGKRSAAQAMHRPSTAPRVVPSFSPTRSRKTLRFQPPQPSASKAPDIRRIFFTRRPLPSALLAILRFTQPPSTPNHHDNDGSTPPFHPSKLCEFDAYRGLPPLPTAIGLHRHLVHSLGLLGRGGDTWLPGEDNRSRDTLPFASLISFAGAPGARP